MVDPNTNTLDYSRPQRSSTSPLIILFAWLVVGLPAAWGVEQTIMKSLPLFTTPAPAAATAPASAPTALAPAR